MHLVLNSMQVIVNALLICKSCRMFVCICVCVGGGGGGGVVEAVRMLKKVDIWRNSFHHQD